MSRCFPYPPPGYLSRGERGEAVRDSIKIKRGKENPFTELDSKKTKDKKHRKEKKERKKHDKGNKEFGYMVDQYNPTQKSSLPRGKEEEAERSDLTEEHEQPVSSLNFCHSPDSGGRDNKRKSENSGSITKAHGNILRIRLPLQRKKEPEESLRSEPLCSSSRDPEFLVQQREASITPCQVDKEPSTSKPEVSSRSVKDASVGDLKVRDNDVGTGPVSSHKSKRHKVDSLYQSLIVDWIPPSLEWDQTDSDDSWLQQSKDHDQLGTKRLKSSNDDQPWQESSNIWPQARYLAEANVFALPYSIPF